MATNFFRELAYAVFDEWLENVLICVLTYLAMFIIHHHKILRRFIRDVIHILIAGVIAVILLPFVIMIIISMHT